MAAAIGAGLPVGEPTGTWSSTSAAARRGRGHLARRHRRLAVDPRRRRRARRVDHQLRQEGVQAPDRPADGEEVKLEIGSAYPLEEEVQAEIRGRDLVSGLPKTVVLTSEEVRAALEEPLVQIIDAIKETLDRTPPELASDIMDRGIMLAGGGSLLQGLDERLREETQMPRTGGVAADLRRGGLGRSLEEFEAIHRSNKNNRNGNARRRPAVTRLPSRRFFTVMYDRTVRRRQGRPGRPRSRPA
jgi:rod shape-determining protein MreB